MDVLASENRRLESESKAARAALTTVEDTATTLRSAAARDREEFDAWKKRARELIDAKDREIDRLRGDGLANGVAAKKPAQIRHHSRAMSTARRHRGGDGDVDVDDASTQAAARSGIFPRGGMGGATKSSSDGGGALRRHERRREENLGDSFAI